MKKPRRKKSNRIAVSRERIQQASHAKKHGFISKKAKLGNGKLSRAVAKKVDLLERSRVIPTFILEPGAKRAHIHDKPTRAPVKVKPALAREMREKGFLVFGNKVIVPMNEKGKPEGRYVESLSQGRHAGVIEQRTREEVGPHRVEATFLEVITLSTHHIENYADLDQALRNGYLDRYAKHEDEVYAFSFTFKGSTFNVRGSRTFFDGEQLADYLTRYKWTEETFEAFELVRMNQGDSLGPTPDVMYKRFHNTRQDRRSKGKSYNTTRAKARALKEKKMAMSHEEYQKRDREAAKNRRTVYKQSGGAEYQARLDRDAARQRANRAAKKAAKKGPKQ